MPLISSDDTQIFYEQHGAGFPVVLIMGLGVNRHGWTLQIPALSSRFRVITLDNRGVGQSGKPDGPYRTAQMAQDTLRLMDALEIDRAHIVGLSMGGMIAQELTLAAPQRVERLALCCTFARAEMDFVTQANSGAFGIQSDELGSLTPESLFGRLTQYLLTPEFIARRGNDLAALFRPMFEGFSMRGFLGQLGAVFTHDAADRLHAVRAPTLVMTGTADRMVPFRHSEDLAKRIPGAALQRFEGASHGFNFEIPDEFNRVLSEFLTD